MENWKRVIDDCYIVGILFIDMFKVFDLLYFLLFLRKLDVYGFLMLFIGLIWLYFIEKKI